MKIAILLCTFNGEKYLKEQLDSYAAQTEKNWTLHVSDDGSSDGSGQVIRNFARQYPTGQVTWRQGPGLGFARNFLSLICSDLQADYFALSDQDDVWLPNKLNRAIAALEHVPSQRPALYGSRTSLVDARGQPFGLSPLFSRPPDLRNALVQTMAGGNTMVMNVAARNLLLEAGPDIDVHAHDWWVYLVVAACGGHLIYDRESSLHYRQHDSNQLGANRQWCGKWSRIVQLMRGDFREWNDRNLNALERLRGRIPEENQALIDDYAHWRKSKLVSRWQGLWRTGLWRQTWDGQTALWLAALAGRL